MPLALPDQKFDDDHDDDNDDDLIRWILFILSISGMANLQFALFNSQLALNRV